MAEAEEAPSTECVFCWSKNERIADPRVLPCDHIACKGCLIGQLDAQKVVWCKDCNKVFDVLVDNLPTYTPGIPKQACDVCIKRGKKVRPATMYCSTCSKKYCEGHQESHDDLHDDHTTLSIAEYVEQSGRLETRNCTEHPTKAYILGCGVCFSVFCTSCISSKNNCNGGKAHELVNLDELVANLTKNIQELKEKLIEREKKLSKLFKEASNQTSDYERSTEEMLEQLHKARDEQIRAIQDQYIKLEEELVEARRKNHEQLANFMEDEVGTMLANLSIQKAEIEARIRNNHQVDIIKAYTVILGEMDKAANQQFPSLRMTDVKSLAMERQPPTIDLKMTAAPSIIIECEPKFSIKRPPKSITFVTSCKTEDFCHSICHYNGKFYLGLQSSEIGVIEHDFKSYKNLTTCNPYTWSSNWPYGIVAHQDRIYVHATDKIQVYDLSGKLLFDWKLTRSSHCCRLAILSNQVVVPDTHNNKLIIFSLAGKPVKDFQFLKLRGKGSSVCAVGNDSVIITVFASSLVFKVNINSGEILWECETVKYPQAAALCRTNFVCILSEKKLAFIDNDSGKILSDIETEASGNPHGWMQDTAVGGDTIVLFDGYSDTLSLYKLE